MNIKEAKIQIKNTISTYFAHDEYGSPLIEKVAQRPLVLMGPPGIGKTAIMSQIAREMNIALVAYSMTHHTRQSVLGLPIIVEKEYGKATEYTMSEIIAEVYNTIENTKIDKGILFLDEINCVSETLVPTMLQFLQYKTLGQHKVPDNWIIVAAGNPNEYNRNARDFDVVTWDRLKRIDIEPSYEVWKEYALKQSVHGSITTYLDIKKENFYRYETSVDGANFVTARAWEDLSACIIAFEKEGIKVDLYLINEYIQFKDIAIDFFNYYELYKKYEEDYQINTIIDGSYSKSIVKRASDSAFDERYSLMGLILNSLTKEIKLVDDDENYLKHLLSILKEVKDGASITDKLEKEEAHRERERRLGILTNTKNKEYERIITFLTSHFNDPFNLIKDEYNMTVTVNTDNINSVVKKINNSISFIEEAFKEGDELTIFITELTINYYSAMFIARHPVDKYTKYSKELSLEERKLELNNEVNNI